MAIGLRLVELGFSKGMRVEGKTYGLITMGIFPLWILVHRHARSLRHSAAVAKS